MTLALLAVALLGQTAPAQPWSVNANGALIWDKQPYLPVGLRIDGDPALIKAAADAGVHDVIVDLPAEGNWEPAIQALKQHEMRYVISISSLARPATAYQIQPERMRRKKVADEGVRLTVRLPGLKSVFAGSTSTRDSVLRWNKVFAAENEQAVVDFKPEGVGQDLMLFPVYQTPASQDYWEGLDRQRDQLLIRLKQIDFGPGLRAILNPMGRVMEFSPDGYWVPDSKLFRLEMESFLQQKYGSPATVRKSWSLGLNNQETYADLARLVPLWSNAGGPQAVLDPVTGRTFKCEPRESTIWADIKEVIQSAMARRTERLIGAIRQTTNIPVILDWAGWNGPYGYAKTGVSGIGFTSTGPALSDYVDDGSYATASALNRRNGAMASWATSLLPPSEEARISPATVVSEMENMGVRGWFFQADKDSIAAVGAAVAAIKPPASTASESPSILPFPEAARDPCFAGRVIGGAYWLPSPGSGSRLELGPSLRGYRFFGADDQFIAVWSIAGTQRVKIQTSTPEALTFTSFSPAPPDPKHRRNELEVTVGEAPLIIRGANELPVFLSSFEEYQVLALSLLDFGGAKADPGGGQRYQLLQSVKDFKEQPSKSLFAIQEIVRHTTVRAAPYLWLEAERSSNQNWTAPALVDGASGGACLTMSSMIPELTPFTAAFEVNVAEEGSYEVWVAAGGSKPALEGLRMQVGNTVLEPTGPRVSRYGPRLGWIPFGQVTIPAGKQNISLIAGAWDKGTLNADVIVLSPKRFTPTGPIPPLDWLPRPRISSGRRD